MSERVWSMSRWLRALVITAFACTALFFLVWRVIGGDLVVNAALGGVAISLWVAFLIVYVKAVASEDKKLYRNALSLVGMRLQSDKEYMQIVVKLSKVPDRPIEYKVDLDNSYTKIDGNRQQQTDSGMSATQIVGKEPSYFQLPRFVLPKSFRYNAIVHYEILCGPPQKSIFRQTRELNVDINYNTKTSQFEIGNWVIVPEDDKTIKRGYQA